MTNAPLVVTNGSGGALAFSDGRGILFAIGGSSPGLIQTAGVKEARS